jgi:hypothetical protein
MKPTISYGNIKVDSMIFNLPAKVTCKVGLECRKYCYTNKDRRFPSVEVSRQNNLECSRSDTFVSDMIALIYKGVKKGKRSFRVHASGDFYCPTYILKWYEIIRSCPSIKFYAFTKRDDLFSSELLAQKPANLTLILSLDGIKEGKGYAKLPKGYDKLAITHKTLTNCTAQKKDEAKCGKDCFKCIRKKKELIILKKH